MLFVQKFEKQNNPPKLPTAINAQHAFDFYEFHTRFNLPCATRSLSISQPTTMVGHWLKSLLRINYLVSYQQFLSNNDDDDWIKSDWTFSLKLVTVNDKVKRSRRFLIVLMCTVGGKLTWRHKKETLEEISNGYAPPVSLKFTMTWLSGGTHLSRVDGTFVKNTKITHVEHDLRHC